MNKKLRKFIIIVLSVSFVAAGGRKNFSLKSELSDEINISFNNNLSEDFSSKDGYLRLDVKDIGHRSIPGEPELPYISTLVHLDPSRSYSVEYSVKSSHTIENIKVFPFQGYKYDESGPVDKLNSAIYSSDSQFPYENIYLSDPGIMRGMVVSSLSFSPYSYNPAKRTLEIFDEVDIVVRNVGPSDSFVKIDERKKSLEFVTMVADDIVNYSSFLGDEEYQQPSILYVCGGNSASNAAFQQLVEWRRQRGYVVYISSLSEIGSSASSIKEHIRSAYFTYDPAPEYVTLVGDVSGDFDIPTYVEEYGHNDYGNYCEGDQPYTELEGADIFPEVFLGRMSVQNNSELTTVSYKIINYEKATYLGNLDGYYERASLLADQSQSGASTAITNYAIKNVLENHGFDDVRIKVSGGSYDTWMESQLEEGVLYFNYRGYLGVSGFGSNEINDASNGYKLPFATVLTCGTGSFAEESNCLSEYFFKAGTVSNPRGAVAVVGTATWNTHTIFNNIVNLGMYDGLFADGLKTAGAALASGKLALFNTYPANPYQWVSAFTHWNNLIGDAATHLWTDTPQEFSADHISSISLGTNFLDVSLVAGNGLPVEGAAVSILRGSSDIPVITYTDAQGLAVVALDPYDSSSLTITASKRNFKPYQSSVSVSSSSASVNIDFDSPILINETSGGLALSGSEVGISIPLIGISGSSSNISAVLTSTSSYVNILSDEVSYGSISQGQSEYGAEFDVYIMPSAVEGEDLMLRIEITDGSSSWVGQINLSASGAYLSPTTNSAVSPGSAGNLNIELNNFGSISSDPVTLELLYEGNMIDVLDATTTFGTINPGQSSESNGILIEVDEDVIVGTILPVTLLISSEEGYFREEILSLQLGVPGYAEPVGPDQYGYYIYDSRDDEFYSLTPSYDWIEIDPDLGGSGYDLNLSDNGFGEYSNSVAHVDLPFTFRFYGLDYNEISICTNGFITFGYSEIASFRNYTIPGPGGPSPMVAAFWDDLKTSNGGDVYAKVESDRVIVEWSGMRTYTNNSVETFQIILTPSYQSSFGDDNIKIQYKEFNNTSYGSYSSYPPIHGGYATIGIENHLANDGIQYTFNNVYAGTSRPLQDEIALFITTETPVALPAPELGYSASSFVFNLEPESSLSEELIVSNTGEYGSTLNYSVSTSYSDLESPFNVDGGGPDSYGYFWSDSDIDSDISYSWIDIDGESSQVVFSDNDESSPMINLPFSFSFYGGDYNSVRINANGWIGFGDDNDAWDNFSIPSPSAPRAAIFALWDDLNPDNSDCSNGCSGNAYYLGDSEKFVVWFEDVYHWPNNGFEDSYYDFQIVIFSSGDIDINYRNIEGNYDATVGIQDESGTAGLQVDNGNSYLHDNLTLKFKRVIPFSWLSLSLEDGSSSVLGDGESAVYSLSINSDNLSVGSYDASVSINTNLSGTTTIPITLNVSDEMGLLGDITGDGLLNVTDIVTGVNLILGSLEPSSYQLWAADVNEDGSINVVDLILIVNLILGA